MTIQAALTAHGLSTRVREYPEGTRTAADAAAAIGCALGQIVKSLIFVAGSGTPLLVLVSGSNLVDEAKLEAFAGEPVRRANANEVRGFTGQAIGGVAPVGHPSPIRTLIDPDLLAHPTLWAAAGTPRTVFEIAPADLVRITQATSAAVTMPAP
ncbi:MAG: YbaK/EbsC family protein [Acidobacteriota bacterium]|nr:YbaK/EbsC family protein [Acidobacteriota bacterium]